MIFLNFLQSNKKMRLLKKSKTLLFPKAVPQQIYYNSIFKFQNVRYKSLYDPNLIRAIEQMKKEIAARKAQELGSNVPNVPDLDIVQQELGPNLSNVPNSDIVQEIVKSDTSFFDPSTFISSLNSILPVIPEYFLATGILSFAIFFSVSQKLQVPLSIKVKIKNFFYMNHLTYLAILILFFYGFLCIKQNFIFASNFVSFTNSIHNDFVSIFAKLIIVISSIIYLVFIQQYLTDQKLNNFEYYIVILTAILGLCLLCCSDDLLTAYLAIELQGLSFYILASFKKTSNYSVESGIKYFILGSFSTVIYLFGINLIYGISGSLSIMDLKDLFIWNFSSNSYFVGEKALNLSILYKLVFFNTIAIYDKKAENLTDELLRDLSLIFPNKTVNSILIEDFFESLKFEPSFLLNYEPYFILKNSILELGLFIILTSLFFKLALSPFYLWSPDIYEGSPSSSTFFFTVISKISIFIFLLKLCYISFYSIITDWQIYLLFVALLSVLVGAVAGLKQRKLKSLLAYSSISNMGLILASFSTGNFEGVKAVFYYFIIYILSGLAIWSIFLILRLKNKKNLEKHNKDLGDFSLLKKSNSILSYALVIILFSVAGIPPTVGFLAKVSIFLSLTTASMYFVAVIIIIATVISTFYYIRILKIIFFENVLVGKLFYPIYSKNIIICSVLFFLLLFLFISPNLTTLYSYKTTLFLNKTFY